MSLIDEYLHSLPRGFASYPGCLAKGSLLRSVIEHDPTMKTANLPAELASIVQTPPLPASWVPEVPGLCLTLVAREVRFSSDEAHLAFVRKRNSDLFRKPLYRAMMWVTSPKNLIAGAPKRWEQFHKGTSLEIGSEGPGHAEVVLRFPPRLFNEFHVRMFGAAFEAAFEAAGATGCITGSARAGVADASLELIWKA